MLQPDLRPLRIGEILDRAVTLFVRRFAVIVLILALVAIPIAIAEYIAQPQTSGMLDDMRRVLSVPPGHQREAAAQIAQLFAKNRIGQWGLGLVVVQLIFSTLSATACVIAVAQAYAGGLPSVRAVYREALRRWPAQLLALGVYLGLAFGAVVGLFIIVFFVALTLGLLTRSSPASATFVGIAIALVALSFTLGVGALLYLAAELTFISIALEDPNPFRGIGNGLRRTLSPALFRRSLLVATIVFVVSAVGSVVLTAIAGTLSVVTHLTALYPIVAVVGGVVLNALVTTFIVIYSIDIRVRREGYDLALAVRAPRI